MVNLVTVKDRELMKVGTWTVYQGDGDDNSFTVTPELIQAAIDAHQSGVLRKPTIRLGHGDERFTGDPAVGWLDNLHTSEDGTTLLGDMVGVPAWLAKIMPSAYPSVSIEGLYDFAGSDGSTHDFVLTGLALLGATPPGITDLKSVQELYEADELMVAAAAGNVSGTPVKVQAARAPLTPGKEHADPGYLDRSGNAASGGNGVPRYQIDDAAHVRDALARFSQFRDKYTPAQRKEILGKILSAAKKFGVDVSDDSKKLAAAAATNMKGTVVTLPDKVAEALGIDASADEATVLAALEALKSADADADDQGGAQGGADLSQAAVAAAAAKMGFALMDQAGHDALVAAAEAGQRAEARQIAEDDERVVMAAIGQGKIPPARKQHWLDSMKADRDGTKQVLASLAAGLVPVVEVGHQGVAGQVGAEGAPDSEQQAKEYANARIMAALGIPTTKESN